MATVKKFIWLDQDGQMREQTAAETIQVANGVNALDAVNKGQLDGAVGDLTDLINSEAARAAQAEAALGDSLSAETAARIAADAALSASLTSETNARTAADTALGGRIDTEISDRQSAVTAEETARIAGDAALRTDLDAEIAARSAAVSAEQTARENADADLQGQIDALENASNAALATAIANLTADIDAEEAARIAADAAIQASLDAEITRATAAEAAEQAARIAADNALQSALNAEAARAAAAETAIASDLAAEISRAQGAEQDLADDIAAEQSRAQAAEATLTSDLTAEITRAEGAEAAIAADLASEISRAIAAEATNLQTAKDYADARVQGLSWKASVDYAYPRTGAYTLPADAASLIAADGLAVGNRVLVYSADQSAHADNGIYVVTATGFERAADMASGKDAAGAMIYVERATDAGAAPGTSFVCANAGEAIVGTDALQFVISSRMENLSFTAGVQKIGTVVSAKVSATKPVFVNGSNEVDFRFAGDELEIDGSGNLKLTGVLNAGTFSNADSKHTHAALSKNMASAATVGVFVDSSGAAVTYDGYVSFGCVDEKSGSDARVVFSGLSNVASGALSSFSDGERVFLGSAAGVFSKYADIPSGKWAVPVGYKQGDKLFVHREPAAQKA
jgi:hypothetical protein